MDKTGISVTAKKVAPYLALAVLMIGFGCSSQPTPKTGVAEVPKNTLAPDPIRVDKPVNVSFSTYSKEWPVNWQWVDPDEKNNPTAYNVRSGVLRITVPTGRDLYGNNRKAPRYQKAIAGDFQIETRVRFMPKENYQGAGILIFKDDENYIRLERAYGGRGGGGEGIRFDVRQGDEFRTIAEPGEIQTSADRVDLKVVRLGQAFIAYWRIDENGEWREVGEVESDYPDTILAGVAVVNTAREVTADFEYIKLLPGVGR
jgi:beta-xylosidase